MDNLSPNGEQRGSRPSIRQVWNRLRPLQRALIIMVLLSALCCASVATIAVLLGVWTG